MSARTQTLGGRRDNAPAFAWREFLRRRGAELIGSLLVAAGVATLLALGSYRAADPSANLAATGHVGNWLGQPGAVLADLLLQTLGLAAVLPAVFVLATGIRAIAHRPLHHLPWRSLGLFVATLAAAAALAALPVPSDWPLRSALGGVAGDIGGGALRTAAGLAGAGAADWLVPVVA
ncbi:MAG: hypothetical protein FJX53_07680, partial [Alphaproteobacteria bacterium]|nr:hypothetical protein [Alphaproteobacteria bacterium]